MRLSGYQYWLCLSSFNVLASSRLLFLPATEKTFSVMVYSLFRGILAPKQTLLQESKVGCRNIAPNPHPAEEFVEPLQKKKKLYRGFDSCCRGPHCPIKGVCRNQTTSCLFRWTDIVGYASQLQAALNEGFNRRCLLPVSLFTSHNCCYSCLILIKRLLKPWNNLHRDKFQPSI